MRGVAAPAAPELIRKCSPSDSIFGAVAPSRQSQSNASITYVAKSAASVKPPPGWNRMSLVSKLYGITTCGVPATSTTYGRSSL